MDVTQLNRHSGPVPQRQVISGVISPNQPAPASPDGDVYVIAPGYSIDRPLGPCKFAAVHGSTLPAKGAECLVVFDDQGVPVVVWWDGAYTSTPAVSSFNGRTGAVTLTKTDVTGTGLAASDVGALAATAAAGGSLSGSYPNPGIAAGAVGTSQLATGIVLQLASTGTPRKIALGTASLNFPGSAISSLLTIPHGLGVIPTFFAYLPEAPSDNITDAICANYTAQPDATNIYVKGRTVSGAAIGPGTTPGRWVAIG